MPKTSDNKGNKLFLVLLLVSAIAFALFVLFLILSFMRPATMNTTTELNASIPVVNSVSITGNTSNYTVTVSGQNFGSLPIALPYYGDINYFRIGENAQLGFGEWGYSGDAKTLDYMVWTNSQIIVSGLQGNPGDSIVLALWNPNSTQKAVWGGDLPPIPATSPTISSLEFYGSNQSMHMIIRGSGFGNSPVQMPFSGDLNYFSFSDWRQHCGTGSSAFGAGSAGWGVATPSSVLINFTSWNNTEIQTSGFAGSYGQACQFVEYGDPISITIWNTSASSFTGPQTAFGGLLLLTNSSSVATNSNSNSPQAPYLLYALIMLGIAIVAAVSTTIVHKNDKENKPQR